MKAIINERPEEDPLAMAAPSRLHAKCCELVTVAHFRREEMVALFKRHTGPTCAGLLNPIQVGLWRRGAVVAKR